MKRKTLHLSGRKEKIVFQDREQVFECNKE